VIGELEIMTEACTSDIRCLEARSLRVARADDQRQQRPGNDTERSFHCQ
jgi:hypothetical protein